MTKNNNSLNAFFIALTALNAVLVVLPMLGAPVVISELLISFRITVSVSLFILSFVFVYMRYYLVGGVQILLVLSNIYPVISSYSFFNNHNTCAYDHKEAPIRIVSFNVYYKNNGYEEIYQNIRQFDADVVVLQEAQPGFMGYAHDNLSMNYPFYYPNIEKGKHDRWTLYSRYPVVGYDKKKTNGSALHAQIKVDDRIVDIITLHAKSPKNRDRIEARNMRISYLGDVVVDIAQDNRHVIVAGDFNNVPWHPVMREFKNKAQLRGNDVLYNYLGTWPTWLPSFASVPIDHIFYGNGFHHASYFRSHFSGSDHYPIISDLYFCE